METIGIPKRAKRGIPFSKRVLVTGDTGFLGHHLVPILEGSTHVEGNYNKADIIKIQGQKLFNLTLQAHVNTMFKAVNSQGYVSEVWNLAALSGGIEDNRTRPASYYYQNMMICTNMIEAATVNKARRLVQFMGGCSYPEKEGEDLFTEDMMWEGRPVGTSAGYSMAKKMTIVAAEAYHQQFGLNTTVLIPTNMIGEWDNFHPTESHVVPALITRFIEARREGYNTVPVWGSGKPVRDFMYAGDVARLSVDIVNKYKDVGPVNISSGKGTSIAELAEIIAKAVGFDGKIHFDRSKPDGQMHKVLSNQRMLDILEADFAFTSVEEAIERTVEWYERRVLR